jgi:hypothetical protein
MPPKPDRITSRGVDAGPPTATDIVFMGSAKTESDAKALRASLPPPGDEAIFVIFRSRHVAQPRGEFILWQHDPPAPNSGPDPNQDEAGTWWDVFRVPDAFQDPPRRKGVRQKIEKLCDDLGQQGDPTGVQPA